MKKLYLFIVFISFGVASGTAQTIAQVTTQLILDTEKLTELKAILSDMYKSYEIINKGYNDIKNIAQGNFNLHEVFLDGLLAVSPAVKNYERVADIISQNIPWFLNTNQLFPGISPTDILHPRSWTISVAFIQVLPMR